MQSFQLREGTITIITDKIIISNDNNIKRFNMQLITGICAVIYFICMSLLNFKRYAAKHEPFDLIFGILGISVLLLGGISAYIRISKYSKANEIEINQIKKVRNLKWLLSRGQPVDLYLSNNKIRRVELIEKDSKAFINTLVERSGIIKASLNN